MKLEAPKDINYCATVCRIPALVPLDNCDNLVGIPLMGLQAIVDKSHEVGELGVFFPTECQLSDGFSRFNNLYRHAEQNLDHDIKGYLEDNRRVRAIKLRGNRSDALFLPLASLEFALGDKLGELQEGDQFDTLSGYDICQKYVIRSREPRAANQQKKAEPRVDVRVFPEQFDQTHWARVNRNVPDEAQLIITQKLHGTSLRVGNVPVKRKLSLLEKLAKRIGVKVQETEHDYVYGSRKVIKDANNPNQQHFYDSDLYSLEGARFKGLIPENYIIYAEIIGWTESGASIQKHYTYDCAPGTRKVYVYRIAVVNHNGASVDLSWDAVKEFCLNTGLLHVPELTRMRKDTAEESYSWGSFLDNLLDVKYTDTYNGVVPLSPDSPCDEGVCIRIEGLTPEIYKHKSPVFLGHESKMLDEAADDMEAMQEEEVVV